MDYEKKYNEALKWMRSLYDGLHGATKEDAEHFFPELKEIIDEQVRKALLEMVHDTTGDELWTNYNVHKEEALAWLEKQGEQKPTDIKTWKYIVDAVLTAKGGIGQYLDDPWTTGVAKRLQERFGNIKQKHVDVKPHTPDGSTDYDKGYEEAQKYISERGFDIPWNDGDVFVDERYILQTVANVLAWGDEHPKQNLEKQGEQKEYTFKSLSRLVDIESMAEEYKQRLINQYNAFENSAIVNMCVESFKHGANCILDELHLKQGQVKESNISKHETETCKENNDSLTSEDERIRKEIIDLLCNLASTHHPLISLISKKELDECIAWLEKQGQVCKSIVWHSVSEEPIEDEELLCEWESEDATWHDIAFYHADTKTFQCYKREIKNVTKWAYLNIISKPQGETQKPNFRERYSDIAKSEWFKETYEDKSVSEENVEPTPKFKVGNWIVNNTSGGVCKITEIKDDKYCLWPLDAEIKGYLRIIDIDNDYHLWTIKDAKDGDVLVTDNGRHFIYKGMCRHDSLWMQVTQEREEGLS